MGRRPDSLYYHVRKLSAAGLLVDRGIRGSGRRAEAVYDIPGRPLRLAYDPSDPENVRAVSRVVASMLRSANRDFRGGFRPDLAVVEGDGRNLWAARMKGWLSDDDLAELNTLLNRILEVFHPREAAKIAGREPHPDKGVARKGRGWPIENPTKSGGTEVEFTPEYVREFTRLLQDADRHFARTYPKTTIIVFQDALDEAGFHKGSRELALAQLRSIQGYLKIFRQARLKQTLYKLDIGSGFARCRYDLDGDGKVEGSKEVVDALGDSVGLWNINGLSIDLDVLRPVLRRGAQVWFYNGFEPRVGPTVIGTEALGPRTWPWVLWNSDIHGMCHWHFLWGTNLKPWVTGGTGSGQRDNKHPGNAMFIYPGEDMGLPQRAFPSTRLKAIRRGLQDYEYFWLLAKADGGRDRAKYFTTRVVRNSLSQRLEVKDFGDDVAGEVPQRPVRGDKRHWSHDPEAFEKVRHRIGEILSRSRSK